MRVPSTDTGTSISNCRSAVLASVLPVHGTRRSRTTTAYPRRVSSCVTSAPLIPAPTTTTSALASLTSGAYGTDRPYDVVAQSDVPLRTTRRLAVPIIRSPARTYPTLAAGHGHTESAEEFEVAEQPSRSGWPTMTRETPLKPFTRESAPRHRGRARELPATDIPASPAADAERCRTLHL